MTENPKLTDFGGDTDPFATGDIFTNRELVYVGHIPKRDRIVGRDNEINFVGSALGAAIEGGPPQNVTINGKTGTGKSLVTRFMAEEAEKRAAANGVNLIHVYLECSDLGSETEAIREIAASVRNRFDAEVKIPEKGISKKRYLSRLWDMLADEDVDSLIVVLDEIDKLDGEKDRDDADDELLMTLSRAEEKSDTDTHIGIICVSNKIQWRKYVDKRVDSSLSDEKTVFAPYDANELRAILNERRDAFKDDVLDDDVIPKIAALAAQEHGDARKAVDMLRYAGRTAERQNDDRVTEAHLDKAKEQAEADQFAELVSGSPPHVKYVLKALARVTLDPTVKPDDRGGYTKTEIYGEYKTVCDEIGSEPMKWDSVSRLLKEQDFLGVIDSKHTGGGRGAGSYKTHELKRDAEIALKALA